MVLTRQELLGVAWDLSLPTTLQIFTVYLSFKSLVISHTIKPLLVIISVTLKIRVMANKSGSVGTWSQL